MASSSSSASLVRKERDLQAEVVDLYQEHCASLLKYAMSVVRNQEEARDAVHEAYLRYFIQRGYGREIDNPRAWLCQVLRNYLLDRLKTMPGKVEVGTANLEGLAGQSPDPEKILQCRQVAAEIARTLTGRELHCLRLHAGGLRYEEIADAMGVRLGTVGALLNRVHQKLRGSRHGWIAMGLTDAVSAFLVEGQAPSS
jgi:RNA polymerase sigma-70 factor (ECF subfamily)